MQYPLCVFSGFSRGDRRGVECYALRCAPSPAVAAGFLFGFTTTASASLVNGSFETGDFTGWTQFGNTGFSGVISGPFSGVNPTDGSFQAFFGPVGSTGGILQAVTANAGDRCDITFWLNNFGGNPNFFDASFDGVSLLTLTDDPGFPYTQFGGTVTASVANPVLAFTFQQNPSYWLLDDVRVTCVPEPTSLALIGLGALALIRRR